MSNKETIDEQLRDQSMNVVFQEGEWAVVHTYNNPVPPWISHWCETWDGDSNVPGTKPRWNYSFSTPYALKNFDKGVLYCCSKCKVRAPDNVITVFELFR